MEDVVYKVSKPWNVVTDLRAGTCYTADACMSIHGRRTFAVCNVDSELVTAAAADFSLTCVFSQILNSKSDISGRAI